jgi:hypothetical protein
MESCRAGVQSDKNFLVSFEIFCVSRCRTLHVSGDAKGSGLPFRSDTKNFFILPFAVPLEFEFYLLLCVPLRETHPRCRGVAPTFLDLSLKRFPRQTMRMRSKWPDETDRRV